jgi:hypothetical protein
MRRRNLAPDMKTAQRATAEPFSTTGTRVHRAGFDLKGQLNDNTAA